MLVHTARPSAAAVPIIRTAGGAFLGVFRMVGVGQRGKPMFAIAPSPEDSTHTPCVGDTDRSDWAIRFPSDDVAAWVAVICNAARPGCQVCWIEPK